MQTGRKGRLSPAVGRARFETARVLNEFLGPGSVAASGKPSQNREPLDAKPLFLVGCSGGPDSLALASVAAHFVRRQDARVGAVIVDHQLQPGSAQVAETAADRCRALGLDPVVVKTVIVDSAAGGPEMAARTARYGAFAEAVAETGASGVLLAHTLDDQAETVLLGLARGSGTRSLAGMAEVRRQGELTLIRPLLNLRRADIEEICEAEELEPWYDPTNADESLMRARVRHTILPFLEEQLGGDVATSLARTAQILGPDSDYLDRQARQLVEDETFVISANLALPAEVEGEQILVLDRAEIAALPEALRRRVLSLLVQRVGGHAASFERLAALDAFVRELAVAGPVQMSGHVSAWKMRPAGPLRKRGVLVLGATQSSKNMLLKR
ncbi:tRNA lysidine(34) synthetase TilS [Rothia aerolata]|uniref:tRNA(Ile)-lysidine synthase n=1 Tax=Rothia aerolata TaxID=1812262 RepID=A0A917IVV1_9MICC|nr:tRNA lysidine(34) synthetase TilS [Rothia aerolata]GGH64193.1 tRNA(Ile)-lysidine synthase [Rothia aerolata]